MTLIDRDARVRAYEYDDPRESSAAVFTMSGREMLEAIVDGTLPPPPMARTLDFRIVEIGDGEVTFEVTPQEFHYNPIGSVHGGLAATLLDSALGCAVQSVLPAGSGYTTVDLAVKYLRPMTTETGPVRAVAKVVHAGRRTATAEARIVDAAGKVYAHGTTTCLVLREEG
ncbi:MAG TPA: PaaI family thioesterase [Acidimicrobiia bacterium]|nr:PaaI family thioesterase [Acidimicrobiia bacterium]